MTRQSKKMISSLYKYLIAICMMIMPMGIKAFAAGAQSNENYDIALNAVQSSVNAGDTGILEMHVKIAGSQEKINEDLSGKAQVKVQLPKDDTYYAFHQDTLESLSILGTKPTFDQNNKVLSWNLENVETGVSAVVQIPVNTYNGITPDGTTLSFDASLNKEDGTSIATPHTASFQIKSTYNAAVSKIYKGVQNSKEEAPKKGENAIWSLKGSVDLAQRAGMYIKPGSTITVTDTLPEGLTYSNSTIISKNLSEAKVNGQTVTWTTTAPSLKEQEEAFAKGESLYLFEIQLLTQVTKDTDKLQKLENKVTFTSTSIDGKEITKKSNAEMSIAPDGDTTKMPDGSWYPSITSGPVANTINIPGGAKNYNPSVNDNASLLYHDYYAIALNPEDQLTRDGVNARSEWKVEDVLKQGYKKIVSKQTYSPELLFSGIRLETPKSYYHSSQPAKRLTTNPVVTIILHLNNGTTKSQTVDFSKQTGIHQVLVSRNAFGISDQDHVDSYEVVYENADGSPIFGGVALDAYPFFNIKKGYEGEVKWQNIWEMTLANGKTYVKSADKTTDNIGPRLAQVVQNTVKTPLVKSGIRFNNSDGNTVKVGENQVRHFINTPYASPVNLDGEISSAIILPYGVKLKGDGNFKFYHQEYRLNIPANSITGTGKVIDDDYKGTGKQLVKVVWDKDYVAPYDQLAVTFDVDITDDAPKNMQLISYSGSTKSKELVASTPDTNTIEIDTKDINDDGLSNDQKIIKASNNYNLRTKEDLKIEKSVKGNMDTEYSRFGKASLGGDISYKLHLTNTTGRNISQLGFIDVLPSVGDLGIVDNTSRGSAFTPILKGPVQLPKAWADKVDVYYSTSKNPKRTDLYNRVNYPNTSFVHADPATAQEANWTKEVNDWSTIHSFKLELKDDTIFVKGQDITLTFDMKAPEKGDKTNLPDESILFTDLAKAKRTEDNEKKAAWNSFAVTTNGLLPTEPERVGVILFDNGGAVRVKYFIEGTDTELDNPEAGDRVKTGETDEGWYTVKDPNTTIGEKYATDNDTLKPEFLKDKDGKTYQLTAKEVRADSDPKDGSVKKDTQYIKYEYKLISGGAVRVKYFIEGTDTELDNPEAGDRVKTGETDEGWYTVKDPNTTIGEKYATDNDTLKPEYLKDKDGKLYKLTAKEVRADSDPKDGSVKADTQYIIYEYKLVEETPKTPEKPHNDEPKNNTPKLEEKKTTTPTPKTKQTKSKAVKTGDDTVLWIYVLLAGISILGGILVLKRNKATR